MQTPEQSPWPVDEAVANASVVAAIVNVAAHLIDDMDFGTKVGGRNHQLDQLHGIVFAADKLMKELVDEIDRLPRVRA